jgi:hypothetical protein
MDEMIDDWIQWWMDLSELVSERMIEWTNERLNEIEWMFCFVLLFWSYFYNYF